MDENLAGKLWLHRAFSLDRYLPSRSSLPGYDHVDVTVNIMVYILVCYIRIE